MTTSSAIPGAAGPYPQTLYGQPTQLPARPYPQTPYAQAPGHVPGGDRPTHPQGVSTSRVQSRKAHQAGHGVAGGILRTVEWKLVTSPEETDQRIRKAFQHLGFNPEGPPGQITGRSKMSFRKNRWAAEISATVSPLGSGSMVLCRVDMAGNKHYALLSEVADAVGDDAFDDQGVVGAVERLGKWSRVFGRKEVRHLHNVLRVSETVLELGQGQYDSKQGLVVLTNERMFFFEKSLGSETIEEFPLAVINSLSINKKMTGETLKIFSSGNQSEIKSMMHGQGDALIRAYHTAKQAPVSPKASGAPTSAAADPFAQIERLGELRGKGLLSDAEFEAKKAEVLGRM
jgi:hypothetical protein